MSLAENAIAENMFAQVDEQGNFHVIMDEIINLCTNGTQVRKDNAFVALRAGAKQCKESTKGWKLLVQWKYGSTTWYYLKDVKESYTVQLVWYSIENGYSNKPFPAWWVKFVMRKCDRIFSKFKRKFWVRTHKRGIRCPKDVREAKETDTDNGNTL